MLYKKMFDITDLYEPIEIKEDNKEKKEDKYIEISNKYTYKMHKKLKFWLDVLIKDLKSNDDGLIIIVAPEGAGKTVFASQICNYLSTKLKTKYDTDNVHFDGQTYIDKSLSSPRYFINHLDESRRALNKMRSISSSNVEFMNFLSECRSQNQIHVVVLPAYTDLEQYVAVHRVKMLIAIEKKRDPITQELIRGKYSLYSTKHKYLLKEAWDRKYKEFPKKMHIFSGKFDNVFCLDEEKYNFKKEQAKKERYSSEKPEDKEKKPFKIKKGTFKDEIILLCEKGYDKKKIVKDLAKRGMMPNNETIDRSIREWKRINYQKNI